MKKTIWPRFRRHGGGFTLIELLVVIAIIVILMGIALQVAKTATDRTRRAATVRTFEALRNALAGYYAAYGQYPPAVGMNGIYPNKEGLSILKYGSQADLDTLSTVYTNGHGLLYYLMAWDGPDVPKDLEDYLSLNPNLNLPWFPRKAERDTAQRWRQYLEDSPGKAVPGIIIPNSGAGGAVNMNLSGSMGTGIKGLTNRSYAAHDGWGWGHWISYRSDPPYQSYRLWSDNWSINGWEE